MTSTESQKAAILDVLSRGKTIAPMEALRRFGCFRLAARIWDLKQDGHTILKVTETNGETHWARYSMPRRGRT